MRTKELFYRCVRYFYLKSFSLIVSLPFFSFIALFFKNGRVVEAFQDDPITNIRYMLNMEMNPNGDEIARQVFDYYLDKNKPYISQHKQFEKVFT